jgi:Protein of unknown function (DUF3105)
LTIESLPRKLATSSRGTKTLAAILVVVSLLAGAACGGEQSSTGGGSGENAASGRAPGEATTAQRADPEETELARAEVGKKEMTNMIPADGKRPDRAQPLPDNPPDGIEVYPATTNRTVRGPIDYERTPPTNGIHDPLWQNCGFYEKPIKDRHAVHSLDHGVVWITFLPGLPAKEVDKLRSYGEDDYVIVSPYPGQDSPVTATSWRVQLELEGAGDPRLTEFVEGFRNSEIAPLSGNRCEGGVGRPAA